MSGAQYARLVPKKYRNRLTPRIDRWIRPRVIAWAGPTAFMNNRFYERDKWYKARIDKPEMYPKMHVIEPTNHLRSLAEVMSDETPRIELIDVGFSRREFGDDVQAKKQQTNKEGDLDEILERRLAAVPGTSDAAREIAAAEVESPDCVRLSAVHHSIYVHLFRDERVFFNVTQQMTVVHDGQHPVHCGNVLEARHLENAPAIELEKLGEGFNTVMVLNLDGNPFEGVDGEVVQMLVSNIPDGEPLESGDSVVPYAAPIAFHGIGYQRIAYIVFRHQKRLENALELPKNGASELASRCVNFAEWYKKNEQILTPSSLAFCQTSWDESCQRRVHEIGLEAPIFAYEWREELRPDQKEFTHQVQPFNHYLDMYRDPKEVEAEVLEERLARAEGLAQNKAPKFIDPFYMENKILLPPWLHEKRMKRDEVREGVYRNRIH